MDKFNIGMSKVNGQSGYYSAYIDTKNFTSSLRISRRQTPLPDLGNDYVENAKQQ
jgi:hypothetical protein